MATWSVPCLSLRPGEAFATLAALPDSQPAGLKLGASLHYWVEAGKLSLELLALERFTPEVIGGNTGGPWAKYHPLQDSEDPLERLWLLASSMPPLCRALDSGRKEPHPIDILLSFLTATIDAAILRWLASGLPLARRRGSGAKDPGVARRWLTAVFSKSSVTRTSSQETASLVKGSLPWTTQLRSPHAKAAFRTCFRLEPPQDVEDAGSSSKSNDWTVTFHLQATDGSGLLIDASTVWKGPPGAQAFLERGLENPQEKLLSDLGRAALFFPALQESLKSPRPIGCKLSLEQVYAFLRESTPLLEERGFGVLAPLWWQQPPARLGVHLNVRARDTEQADGAMLGLSSLVHYDWEVSLGEERLGREEFERLVALKVPLVQVRGQWIALHPLDIEAAIRFFDRRKGELTLSKALHLGLSGKDPGTGLPILGLKGEGWIGGLLDQTASGTTMPELAPPAVFNGALRPYQVRGYSWMAFLDQFGLGACLADDMGLGKTIQIIALLLLEKSLKTKDGAHPDCCPHVRCRKLATGDRAICAISQCYGTSRIREALRPGLCAGGREARCRY